MEYSIEYHPRESYIGLNLQGEPSLTEFERVSAEVGALMSKHHVIHLLVDARQLITVGSTLDLFQFHSSHNDKFPPGVRIAGLVKPEHLQDGMFAENVAQNRGVMIKVFTDDVSAIAWLNDRSDQ